LNRFVLDGSVAAKWLLPSPLEPFADKAIALLARYKDHELQILVPDLFWAEIGSVLWKASRTNRCTRAEADAALENLAAQDFPTISSKDLLAPAFRIAQTSGRSVYDCLYVALAIEFNTELVTADEKLANAMMSHYPVRLLATM